jgi:hypothetical protein
MAQEIDPLAADDLDLRWAFRPWQAGLVDQTNAGGSEFKVYGRFHCSLRCDNVDYYLLLPGSVFKTLKS